MSVYTPPPPLPARAGRVSAPEPVRTWSGDLAAAFDSARAEHVPLFVPQSLHADDRGWSLMNQLTRVLSPEGQVNFSMQYPGVIKAWHRHAHQTDFWLPLLGHIKAGVYDENSRRAWLTVVGEKRPGVVIIPPGLWHGAATVGETPAGLLYYVTHAYNPAAPDEERRPFDSVSGFPWGVRNG